MPTEFIIKKGRSTSLFDENGVCRIPQEKLIENGWYLTTDTAEVYVALRQSNDLIDLKKINECNIDVDLDLSTFEDRITTLEEEEKLHTYGYRSGFPDIGQEGHLYVAVDQETTYVWWGDSYHPVGTSSTVDSSFDIIYGGTAD